MLHLKQWKIGVQLLMPLMPDEDKNFGGSLVLDFRK